MQMTPNQLLQRTPIRVDSLVSKSIFPNRSRAIQAAVSEKLARMERGRLASKYAMHRSTPCSIQSLRKRLPRRARSERIGAKPGRSTPEELALVVEGLNEIFGI